MNNLEQIPSAWKGHKPFANWLIDHFQPKVTVDLGVDYGYSSFVFSQNNSGIVFGIDLFKGDEHTGFRDSLDFVKKKIKEYNITNLQLIKGDFKEVSEFWTLPIDILHIDGLHTYEAVSSDYHSWAEFVQPNGIILFHDTQAFPDTVGKFFLELPFEKINFEHSAGLGIVSQNSNIIRFISHKFNLKII